MQQFKTCASVSFLIALYVHLFVVMTLIYHRCALQYISCQVTQSLYKQQSLKYYCFLVLSGSGSSFGSKWCCIYGAGSTTSGIASDNSNRNSCSTCFNTWTCTYFPSSANSMSRISCVSKAYRASNGTIAEFLSLFYFILFY